MKKLFICIIICTSLFILGCKGDITGLIPQAGGKAGEMVMVIDEAELKSQWVDSIKQYLNRPMPILPQDEPYWEVYRVTNTHFQNLYRVHRNVLILKINPAQTKAAYAIEKDIYAKGQVSVTIAAANSKELMNYFFKIKDEIEEIMRKNDFEILAREYNKIVNKDIQNRVKEVIGLKLSVPDGYYIGIDTVDFVYFLSEGLREIKTDRGGYDGKIQRSIWVATGDYKSTDIYTRKGALKVRDSIAKNYILSAKEGSYMHTESLVPTDSLSIEFNGERALVQRGLWRMKDEFKGGPFINIVSFNPQTQKWIMLDGFVYAPQFKKRDYMIQIEGILKSATK